MKIIEMREFGGPDVLQIGSRKLPEIGDDEVLVKVICAGVNGPDLVQRRGHYPPPKGASDLLGLEVSGEIVGLGKNVANWRLADRVCALTNGGGYAQYVSIEQSHCLPLPQNIGEFDCAGLPETYFTVWSNCFYQREYRKDAIFLVHGGAGGIGSTAIQIGAAMGMRVFTTCSNDANTQFCLENGAERAINYNEEDFVDVIREAGGANLILDIIGGDYVARNIKAAALDARIVQLAFNKGSKMDINLMPIMLKRLIYTGSTLRSRPKAFKSAIANDLRQKIWPLFEQELLKSNTHSILPFEEATGAHEMMEAANHRGKILLKPW